VQGADYSHNKGTHFLGRQAVDEEIGHWNFPIVVQSNCHDYKDFSSLIGTWLRT
jgi:hypothetical protein